MRRVPALLLFAALAAGCAKRPQRVVFGVALARSAHPAVALAVREINAAGGIGGVPLALSGMGWHVDSEFPPEEVLAWAGRFAADRELLAVVGPSDSTSTLTMAAVLNRERVPEVVTIATNPAITRIGPYTFRLCLSDAVQGPALADYAVTTWRKRRIALLFVADDYGRGLAQGFETRATELGARIVWALPHGIDPGDEDLAALRAGLKRLAGSPPDLFVLFERVTAAEKMIPAIREAGFATDLLAGDNVDDPAFIARSPSLVEGMRLSRFFDGDAPAARAFARLWGEGHATPPEYSQAYAYDAVHLLARAVREGGFSREGVRRRLEEFASRRAPLTGATGDYVLAPDHDARRPFHIAECRGGRAVVVKTLRVE